MIHVDPLPTELFDLGWPSHSLKHPWATSSTSILAQCLPPILLDAKVDLLATTRKYFPKFYQSHIPQITPCHYEPTILPTNISLDTKN